MFVVWLLPAHLAMHAFHHEKKHRNFRQALAYKGTQDLKLHPDRFAADRDVTFLPWDSFV